MAKIRVSPRLSSIEPFKVMEVLRRAIELSSDGADIVHMAVGEPDFPTPEPITIAGRDALMNGSTKYTDARGLAELRLAVANYYATDYGLDVDENRIFITPGASGALLLTTALLMEPGDEIILSDPGYPCNRNFLAAFSGTAHMVPVGDSENYQLNGLLVDKNWRETTRGVLLASPANPTGAVIGESVLEEISFLVDKENGCLISDEIYHGLIYSDAKKVSALQVSPDAFVLNSFSKYFGMTGWRLGWLIAPASVAPYLEKMAQNFFICPSSISQHAALAAFTPVARDIMEAQREEFKTRRDFLLPALRDIGFDVPIEPEGAFYIYAGLPEGFLDSESFTQWLLEEHHVAIAPGTDFGSHLANRHVRFSYAQPLDRLQLGVERLQRAIQTG